MVLLINSGDNGKNGTNGNPGKNGDRGNNGGNGGNGTNGEAGGDASPYKVVLSSGPNNELFIDGEKTNEIIGNNNCFVEIQSQGGRGGKGGNGGNGGRGSDGSPGQDAKKGVRGTDGSDGRDGGDGGDGGNGGNGGNGSSVTVSVSEKDTDLLYLVRVLTDGGEGGYGGNKGNHGTAGYPGRGGNAYLGFNGVPNQDRGKDGQLGRKGKDGQNGVKGKDGKPGYFCFHIIEQNKNFDKLFNLVMVTLYNETAMSTPSGSPITVSLQEDPLIVQNVQENTQAYNLAIAGGSSVTLPKQFEFKIAPQLNLKVNSPLNLTYKLKFKASLNRVKAEFKGVSAYEQAIKIEYPVELTFVSAPRSFTDGEEIPIAIGIKNKSNKPLGINNGRLLNLRFYNLGKPGTIKFTPYSSDDQKQIDQNNTDPNAKRALDQSNFIQPNQEIKKLELIKQVFIPHIGASETIFFKGTIKVDDPSIESYDSTSLKFYLDIGHIDEPANKYQTIQENDIKLQKSEQLQYREKSDVLLIINSEVRSEQIEKISNSLKVLGTDCDVYSISQYKNFDYHFDPQNKRKAPFAKKAVVIYGNAYSDYKNEKTNAVKEIGIENIYKSAYEDDTRNYIIGSSQFINFGRIFNYPALKLYQGSTGHETRQSFPYFENFKIMISDIALSYQDYYSVYRQLNEQEQGMSMIHGAQQRLLNDNSKLPKEMQPFAGIEQECPLLYTGNLQQEMKNVEEITSYFKYHPTKIESVKNLDTSFRLKLSKYECMYNYVYDKNDVIMKQVKSTHEKLQKLDPTHFYHTRHVYYNEVKSDPNKLEEYIGQYYKSSGNQYIIRGLRKDCAQIAFSDKGEEVPQFDDGDLYNILKIIPVSKKIGYISTFQGQNESIAEILFSSIASDLCDEFKTYTSISMRSGWSAPQYLDIMQGWKSINAFNFDTLVQNKNVFLLQKFLVMIQSVIEVLSAQVGFFAKSCCCCLPIPSATVLSVCNNVYKTISPKINACEGASDKVSDLVNQKLKNANNPQLKFDLISRPDKILNKGSTFFSNQSSCIVQVFDPVPAWIRQELKYLSNSKKQPFKIDLGSSKKVYQNEQQRKQDIDKYVQSIIQQKN